MVFSHLRKINKILSKRERKSAFFLLVMMVLGMFIETLGIGAIMPLMYVLSRPAQLIENSSAQSILKYFGSPSESVVVISAVSLLGFLFLIKGVLLTSLAYRQSRFIFDVKKSISSRLFEIYLEMPYLFHVQNNSAILIRNITQEISYLTLNGLIPILQILSEAMVVIAALVLLFVVEPVGALVAVGVMFVFSYSFSVIFRSYIFELGKKRQFHDAQILKHLQQGLGGIKDIKVSNTGGYFWKIFDNHNLKQADVMRQQSFLGQLPRIWVEVFCVAGVVVLVVAIVFLRQDVNAIIPVLGLFGATAIRFVPSTNRIVGAVQSLKYGVPAIDLICSELAQGDYRGLDYKLPNVTKLSHSLINIESLSFSYSEGKNILADASMSFRRGEAIGIVGTSGVGKSTFVDILLGLLTPTAGNICVDGVNIFDKLIEWQCNIGYVSQSFFLSDDSLEKNIAFGVDAVDLDREKLARAIRGAQLESFISSLPEGVHTLVGERGTKMSGGQRQRIAIARALYHDPEILIFDEATSALDCDTEEAFIKSINCLKGYKTLVIIAHRMSTVSICDRVYRLDSGRFWEQKDFLNESQ